MYNTNTQTYKPTRTHTYTRIVANTNSEFSLEEVVLIGPSIRRTHTYCHEPTHNATNSHLRPQEVGTVEGTHAHTHILCMGNPHIYYTHTFVLKRWYR